MNKSIGTPDLGYFDGQAIDESSLRAAHNELLESIGKAIDGAVVEILGEAKANAQNTTEIKNRSGRMKRGWDYSWRRTRQGAEGSLFNDVKHALFQEYGTGLYGPVGAGYFITARPGGFLRFRGKDGTWVFRKWVFHRGVTAKYIGKRAFFGQNQTASGGLRPTMLIERWLTRATQWK